MDTAESMRARYGRYNSKRMNNIWGNEPKFTLLELCLLYKGCLELWSLAEGTSSTRVNRMLYSMLPPLEVCDSIYSVARGEYLSLLSVPGIEPRSNASALQ